MADALSIHASSLDAEGCYKLLSGVVVPRPIAWITTQSEAGLVNLAPFSCYTYVCSKPPMVGINIGRRAGQRKDTSRNIVAHGEFVVNIGDETMVEAVHRSADEYPPEVSETQLLGLELAPSELIADCFALARDIREVDMRASPYDLRALGFDPITIETAAGRADYEAHQRAFSTRAEPLRARLLALCERLLA